MSGAAIESAKDLLRRVGLSTPFNEDDFREIASSSGSGTSISTPPMSASESRIAHSQSRLSLPPELLDELSSPSIAHPHGMEGRSMPRFSAPSDAIRQDYEGRIARMTEELAAAHHNYRLLEIEMNKRIRSIQTDCQQIQAACTADVQQAKASEAAAIAQCEHMKERIQATLSNFMDLNISTAMYEDLCRLPPDTLSVRQFVVKRAFEHTKESREQLERCRFEYEQKEAQWRQQQAEYERLVRESLHKAQIAEAREAGLKEQVSLHEATIQRLQSSLADALRQADLLHSKGVSFDSIDSRRRELEVLHDKDAQVIAAQQASLEVAKADRQAAVLRADDLQMKVELLTADKSSLSAALEETRLASRRAHDEIRTLETRLSDVTKQRDAFQEQLVRTHSETRSAAEERLRAEVTRLREESAREMQEIRTTSKEAYERELQSLRSARDDAIAEVQRLQARVDSLQAAVDDAKHRGSADTSQQMEHLAELRGALKLKSFEAERIALTNAELHEQVRNLTRECELLREKVSLIQTEYVRMDAEHEKVRVNLESALQFERQKIEQYEKLELELDNVVLAAGKAEVEGVETASSMVEHGVFAGNAMVAPISIRRRLRQAVMLTKELIQAQEEVATLKKRLAAAEMMTREAEEKEQTLQIELNAIRGPQEYFVSQLRSKDATIKALKDDVADARAQLQFTRSTLQQVNEAKIVAETNLKRLAAAKSDVSTLAAVVKQALTLRSATALDSKPQHDNSPPASHSPEQGALQMQQLATALSTLFSAQTATSVPLTTADLHVPPRSTNSTPLDNASSRQTTPPHPVSGNTRETTPLHAVAGNTRESTPVRPEASVLSSDSKHDLPRYDLQSVVGHHSAAVGGHYLQSVGAHYSPGIQFSADMPHSEGITFVASRQSAASRPKWHRRLHESSA